MTRCNTFAVVHFSLPLNPQKSLIFCTVRPIRVLSHPRKTKLKKLMRNYLPQVVLFLIASSPALAYIDPGSGHLLSQVLMAGIAGGLFHFRNLFRKLFHKSVSPKTCETKVLTPKK